MHEFTAGFLFAGLGAGARGFLSATAKLKDESARFRNLGGVDNDPAACRDFETLTGGISHCADVSTMQPAELRAAFGDERPDCLFASPPCKGFSGLLSTAASQTAYYQGLNQLALQGLFLACETWPTPPPLILVENVPRIASRGAELLRKARQLLHAYGYVFHEGFHDCGLLGGLAQHRRRFLLIARHARSIPNFVYQPREKPLKACGDVLGPLPLPEDPSAGPLHRLPRLSWINWVRLALIPAGGDWRDLPSHGASTVAGPERGYPNKFRMRAWNAPAGTVTGDTDIQTGAPSVCDPRIPLAQTAAGAATFKGRPGLFGVNSWEDPLPTVTASTSVSASNAVAAVADPRLATPLEPGQKRRAVFARHGVLRWDEPADTIAGAGTNGAQNVADPRIPLGCVQRSGAYGVSAWDQPLPTVTGSACIDNGTVAVADPRIPPHYRAFTIEQALAEADRAKAPPKGMVPVIVSPHDGTWHRPLTTLELAVLQGLPSVLDGQPLVLDGRSNSAWRERIGNAVPVAAAQAIAEEILKALLSARLGTWSLSPNGIWVRPREDRSLEAHS